MLKGGMVAQAKPGGNRTRETGPSFSARWKVNPGVRGMTQSLLSARANAGYGKLAAERLSQLSSVVQSFAHSPEQQEHN